MSIARHISCLVAASMWLLALGLCNRTTVHAAGKPLVVIVSVATPLEDISTALLRRAFTGEAATFGSGKRLIPINHPLNVDSRAQFDRTVLGLNPEEVGNFWIDRRIRDQSGPPKTVPSADLALRVVMSLPGAISYVYADQLNDKVRALTVDGQAYTSAGYLLAR